MTSKTVQELEDLIRDRVESEEDADNLIYLSLSIAAELADLGEDGQLIAELVRMRMLEMHCGNETLH
ncbi:hypothetical protein QJS83_14745 [Bdellovibrio sp. 22V]|uniref:hypothetical protein n=1 Tax=Bdellovibrio sp. 22V TaxID=3044166 RepID=UPI002543CD8A|nr:hypothetical protein [Bdellovibrio sp. 22V]WII71721.1 hypothetical protein QJS83_14745 [Bdellovibrio sp. 22V]